MNLQRNGSPDDSQAKSPTELDLTLDENRKRIEDFIPGYEAQKRSKSSIGQERARTDFSASRVSEANFSEFDGFMRKLSLGGAAYKILRKAELEVLRYTHRVVCLNRGHGERDLQRGARIGIELIPELLAARRKKFRPSTYKQAIRILKRFGFLVAVSRPGRRCEYSPAWCCPDCEDAAAAFEAAIDRLRAYRKFDRRKPTS